MTEKFMSKTQNTTLKGGAAQLREVHDQWILACAAQTVDGVKGQHGVLVQEQSEAQSRQRVLAIELWLDGERLKGALVLPFGLALHAGATLCVDEGGRFTLPFRTSLPVGIVVDLEFDVERVAELRAGETLKVTAVTADSGQEVAFAIPLAGFRSAYDRLQELVQ